MTDKYLSVTQVANQKQISRNAVYKAIQDGRLPSTQIAGLVVIRFKDAEAWQPKARTGRRSGSKSSDETKAKIAESQRIRWQKRKEQE